MSQKTAKDLLDEFEAAFAQEFKERVQRRTPVVTGRTREAWEAKVNNDVIEVSNPLDHAPVLEQGNANRNPVAMVRSTLEEAQQITDEIARRIK